MARIEYEVDVMLAHPAPGKACEACMARQGSSPRPPSISSRPEGGPPVSHAQETQEKRKEKGEKKKKRKPTLRRAAGITLQYGARRKAGSLVQPVRNSVDSLPAHQKKRKSKKETERIRDEKRGSGFSWTLLFCRSKPC